MTGSSSGREAPRPRTAITITTTIITSTCRPRPPMLPPTRKAMRHPTITTIFTSTSTTMWPR